MTMFAQLSESLRAIGMITGAMVLLALVETVVPLHARGRWNREHLGPNLVLTLITFATNAVFNVALVGMLFALESAHIGVLHVIGLGPFASAAIAIAVLDFSFYVAHVSMHKVPVFWRGHRVHHSDPAVDVTTTVRQHPLEGVIRYTFLGLFAAAIGPSPGAFAVYRAWSALNAVMEHANFRIPVRLGAFLSLVTTWPHMHKVHHSRIATETDSNYGNIFSWWDRLFFTYTPQERGTSIGYGLDGLDDAATQTTAGLLMLPFRREREASVSSASATAGTASTARP